MPAITPPIIAPGLELSSLVVLTTVVSHDDCSCELLRGGDVEQFNATHIGSPPL